MIFAWPLAVLGLLAVPALAALYFLRQRSRRRRVSSLLLWRGEPPRRDAGRRLERFAAPLLFWLELAAIVLLVVAMAGPHVLTPDSRRPLVVVLDDSYSMRAGGAASPRAAATAALREELGSGRHSVVTLVLAGERPQVLSDGALETSQAAAALDGWQAAAPAAALDAAVALARELGGERARLLVVSDQAPPAAVEGLAWWAFGRPRGNLAVVHAVRSREDTDGPDAGGRCLLQIANFSSEPAATTLRVRYGDAAAETLERPLRLSAAATTTVRLPVPAGAAVHLELGGDDLPIDDRVVLLPETARPVRVANELRDPALRALVAGALAATGGARMVTSDAELMISDQPAAGGGEATWTVRLAGGERAEPYVGPFVLDLDHPLAEGLSLPGVIWAAPPRPGEQAAAGLSTVVVSAGDVPLLVDREHGGAHHVTLRFQAELSTLQRTPNWPILWWNLLQWRAASAPGLRRHNVRLGETVTVTLAPGDDTLRWRPPGGAEVVLPAVAGRIELRAAPPGVHEVGHGDGVERFAVNALAAAESDLRQAASGRWGGWEEPGDARWAERPVGWIFVLSALALLLLHLRAADGRRGAP